jgi:dihydroorotate dehydrogenase
LYPDAEASHHAGITFLKELWIAGLHPRERGTADFDGLLNVEVFGHLLTNPIGISAGLDKNAEVPDALLALGPAVIEVGGVTPLPQDGNPKPRVFRVPSQQALVNRYGLNSEGADVVAMRLRQRVRAYAYQQGYGIDEAAERLVLDGGAEVPPGSLVPGRLLAVQIAKNKLTPEHDLAAVIRDHVYCVERIGKYADIIVVNVSSPNTPGLRSLQSQEPLTQILFHTVAAANMVDRKVKPAVMVKVSPDEDSDTQIQGICDAVWEAGVDGVIVANTTKRRPDPWPQGYMLSVTEAHNLLEQGGYSGPQLFPKTVALVKRYRKTLDARSSLDDSESRQQNVASESNFDSNPNPPPTLSNNVPTPSSSLDSIEGSVLDKLGTTQQRDDAQPKPTDPPTNLSFSDQPLIQLPERHTSHGFNNPEYKPTSQVRATGSSQNDEPKVIFASGGITNGEQALEVLNAGASVAMLYTTMAYGGVGTVSRIKAEMREKIKEKEGRR